jgi:hypothetical protein
VPSTLRITALAGAALALAAGPLGAQATSSAPAPGGAHAGMPHARGADHGSGHEAEARSGAWPQMDAFHQTLHAAWHPAAGRGDLGPARAQAPALAARARTWARSPRPATCAALPAGAVDSVAAGARAFAALAPRRGNDAAAMRALRALHARFEGVERGCTGHGDAEHAGHGNAPARH